MMRSIALVAVCAFVAVAAMPGSMTPEGPATPHMQDVIARVRPQFEERTKMTPAEFTAITFRSQLVSGTNYLVKVHIGEAKYAHVHIYEPLAVSGLTTQLNAIKLEMTMADPLVMFEDEHPVAPVVPGVPGGHSQEMPADEKMHGLVKVVREPFEEHAKFQAEEFTAISYTKQVVAGTLYFVKVHLGSGKYAHLRIFEHLPNMTPSQIATPKPELQAYQLDKALSDPIEHFDKFETVEPPMPGPGGVSGESPADEHVSYLTGRVRYQFEKQASVPTVDFTAISFTKQVVAGTNYFVKVHVGCGEYAHVRIYEPFPNSNQMPLLQAFQLVKELAEPIMYFEENDFGKKVENDAPVMGGPSSEQPATDKVHTMVSRVQPQFMQHMKSVGRTEEVQQMVAVTFKSQVVSGTNYFIKVHLGQCSYAHMRVFEPLRPTLSQIVRAPQLQSVQLDKTRVDSIEMF